MLVVMRRDNMPDFAMYWMRSISTSSKYGKFGDWRPNRWERLQHRSPNLGWFRLRPIPPKIIRALPLINNTRTWICMFCPA